MPIISGADLTSVSTERQAWPEGTYKVTVKESVVEGNGKTLIIKSRIDETDQDISAMPQSKSGDHEYWDYINLVQNDGKQNRISLEHIKRYLEAVFGKGSAEAEASPPDTDVLNGHSLTLYVTKRTYTPGGETEERTVNNVKRVLPA